MKIVEKELNGKAKLVLVDLPDSSSVTAIVFAKVGSRLESKEQNGISHLVEHCIFKGSKKFPTPQIISFSLEGLGASIDAGTSKEYTYYLAKSVTENFLEVFEILLDIYVNPLVEQDHVNSEKKVVLEEIRMYKDDPVDNVSKIFTNNLWKGQSIGRDISGSIKNVKSFDSSDIKDFIKNNYTQSNTEIVICGNLKKFKDIEDLINKKLKPLSNNKSINKTEVIENLEKDTVISKSDDVQQTHLILGTYGVSLNDDSKFAAAVGNTILGQGMGSKLYRTIRHEHGLAYYINSGNLSYTDSGAIYVRAGVDKRRLYLALESIVKEIKNMMMGEFTEQELHRAKQMLKSALTLELDGSDSMGIYMGIQYLLVEFPQTIEDVKKAVDDVTKDEIINTFQTIFAKPLLLSVISSHSFDKSRILQILEQRHLED